MHLKPSSYIRLSGSASLRQQSASLRAVATMLASRSRISAGVASGMRPAAMVPLANAPVRRCVAPIVARAGLAPLVDALKADQLRSDLPQVRVMPMGIASRH